MQECVSSNKIKENKYKILRMSLLLGSGVDREDTFNNFEDAAREIDAMNDEVYLKNIEDKFYDTLKLEEEEEKLAVLVDYIGGRVEQRISLLSDFANVTGYDLQNLPSIKYYDKLDDYKERLGYIREYLSNTKQINLLNEEIEKSDKRLNEAYLNRASSEEHNKKIEDTLLDKFTAIFKTLDFFEDTNESNVEEKINDIMYNVEDSKKSLDIFTKSFTTLTGSGISVEEEQEYFSYVENAKCAYYTYKEQEYILRLYRLLINKYTDYGQILYKREEINDILYERLKLRKELKIAGNDLFSSIYDLLERQYEDIKRQNVDIENIEKLTNRINEKRTELNRLETENNKVEILSLLREFCIIDTYNDINNDNTPILEETNYEEEKITEEFDIGDNESFLPNNIEINVEDNNDIFSSETIEEIKPVIEEEVNNSANDNKNNDNVEINHEEIEEVLDNEVVMVEDATGIDLELIQSKAGKVMQRVGEMLGIKVEKAEIISVTNEEPNIFMDETNNDISKETVEDEKNMEDENPLFNNQIESSEEIEMSNPLFDNEINFEDNISNNPLFEGENLPNQEDFSINDNIGNDFWFQSDTPDALNELPDLNISNDDFFANNNMADLEFPDLDMNFPNNDMEEKI